MSNGVTEFVGIELKRDTTIALHRQLYEEIRHLILANLLLPGEQIPPTRKLCKDLALSRSTVIEAIAQLKAEGYLEGKVGKGTFVCTMLPDATTRAQQIAFHASLSPQTEDASSLANTAVTPKPDLRTGLFRSGMPDIEQFPFKIWRKLMHQLWQAPHVSDLGYGDPAGYYPLRQAIADHVRLTRRVKCTPEQVIITAGAQQALYLSASVLLNSGDSAWVENPGYNGTHMAFRAAGASLIPVSVDDDGIDVEQGIVEAQDAKLAYICPSHQYPLGGTLSLPRRLRLLEWAEKTGAYIIEDDYDSEYRYTGHPLAALQGLDSTERVIYMGTFSKVMFPSLRLGYMIVPPRLFSTFQAAREAIDRGSCLVTQMALHQFMVEGHFSRHIRRSRVLYAGRQRAMLDAIEALCPELLEVRPFPAGMHLLAWLPNGWNDKGISQKLAPHGISAAPLSNYSLTPLMRGGLLFGYAAHDKAIIWKTIKIISEIITRYSQKRSEE